MAKRFEKAREYTKKYGPQLLPCRFCGNTDIRIVSDRTIFPPKDGWGVVCTTDSCDSTITYTSFRGGSPALERTTIQRRNSA